MFILRLFSTLLSILSSVILSLFGGDMEEEVDDDDIEDDANGSDDDENWRRWMKKQIQKQKFN